MVENQHQKIKGYRDLIARIVLESALLGTLVGASAAYVAHTRQDRLIVHLIVGILVGLLWFFNSLRKYRRGDFL